MLYETCNNNNNGNITTTCTLCTQDYGHRNMHVDTHTRARTLAGPLGHE